MATPLFYSDEVETIPSDQAENIEQILEILGKLLKRRFEVTGHYRRDVHVKSHGCVRGEFRVLENLPADLSQGLFARPGAYTAFVRFSNSAPWVQPDVVPDGRGLAIQVEGVSGEMLSSGMSIPRQDFVMVNHPTFIARDVKDYLRLEQIRLRAKDQRVALAAGLLSREWNPLKWRWHGIFAAASVAAQPPAHPASYTYYSMVPIRFGQHIAKYRVMPSTMHATASFGQAASFVRTGDAMRQLLQETLLGHELIFQFQVQLRTSERSMPIEDAMVEWPARESPYRTVADLVLPRQNVSAHETSACERRSFNVWNALTSHRPLGGINRVRRLAYPLSAACRVKQELV